MSLNSPYFSIIIPTYNRARYLERLIKSLLNQHCQDFEIIVVDDGGTDNTSELIKDLNDNRVQYYYKLNGGVSSARNFGLKKATGKYINFFDSDDLSYPNHLSTAKIYFETHKNCQVLLLDYDWGDESQTLYKTVTHRYENPNKTILRHNFISTNAILIERSLTEFISFNEKLFISEDWEYWIRLSTRAKFCVENRSTTYITEHAKRGINILNPNSLVKQKDFFIESINLEQDLKARSYFKVNILIAHFDSLIALNYALVGKKKETLRFLLSSLKLDISSLFNKRTLAILKHFFITW